MRAPRGTNQKYFWLQLLKFQSAQNATTSLGASGKHAPEKIHVHILWFSQRPFFRWKSDTNQTIELHENFIIQQQKP